MRKAVGALCLLLGACTIEDRGGGLEADFHPPLVYAQWETESYTDEQGRPVCAVTSGYQGLTVLLRRKGEGASVSVKGTRRMMPGTDFSVSVNGRHYRTSDPFFHADDAARMAEDLAAGGKAYLEWSEPRGDDASRVRYTNILLPEGFRPRYEQCLRSVAPSRAAGGNVSGTR